MTMCEVEKRGEVNVVEHNFPFGFSALRGTSAKQGQTLNGCNKIFVNVQVFHYTNIMKGFLYHFQFDLSDLPFFITMCFGIGSYCM